MNRSLERLLAEPLVLGVRQLDDGRVLAIRRQLNGWLLTIGTLDHLALGIYDDEWEYAEDQYDEHDGMFWVAAQFMTWNAEEGTEPLRWSRHRPTGRRQRCGWHGGRPTGIGDGGPLGLLLMGTAGDIWATGYEGQWVKEYDPRRPGRTPLGTPISAHIATTEDPAQAMRFADASAARRLWMQWDGDVRPDGRPSRPLTMFNIEISRLPA